MSTDILIPLIIGAAVSVAVMVIYWVTTNDLGPIKHKSKPVFWENVHRFRVLQPDGWHDAGIEWDEPITEEQFLSLAAKSWCESVPRQIADFKRRLPLQ